MKSVNKNRKTAKIMERNFNSKGKIYIFSTKRPQKFK